MKILLASAMDAAGKLTWCSTEVSSFPLNTLFCSRPLGTTSISRTTMSARLPPALRAVCVRFNLPVGAASSVNCETRTRAVGHHFDLADYDVVSVPARHARGQRQFEFADARSL